MIKMFYFKHVLKCRLDGYLCIFNQKYEYINKFFFLFALKKIYLTVLFVHFPMKKNYIAIRSRESKGEYGGSKNFPLIIHNP